MSKRIYILFFTFFVLSQQIFSAAGRDEIISKTLQNADDLIQKALEAEEQNESRKMFREAGNLYLKLSSQQSFSNGRLMYNAGNCFMLSSDIGKAIYCYKNALLYIPLNKDLRNNLVYARSLAKDDIPGTASAWGGRRFMSRWALIDIRIIASVLILLWLPLIFLYFRSKRKNNSLRNFYKSPGFWFIIAIYLFIVFMELMTLAPEKPEGVVIADECIARKGDSTSYAPAFQTPIHQGTEFLTLDKRSGWLYIQLADGRECWVEEDQVWIIKLKAKKS